jgi:adenine-specific DNA-methyltransferase
MAKKSQLKSSAKTIESLTHNEAKRKNIPTAEYQSVIQKEEEKPRTIKYPRNNDLDPQLVWRGKDEQDWSDLVVHAPPLYIQEKVHPKVLIDDLLRQTREQRDQEAGAQTDLFADFNGVPAGVDKTEFYQHDQNWSNRMILGDSLQVMASLAEREGLRGKVQCIYIDPPYGIKFNSNFQWSTTSRDVKDGNAGHITREPEQVKAFRDTWRDGIHSYLTYFRDRLTVARDLLTDSGSIFVQIGDENVHRIRALMDEVFGADNFSGNIVIQKGGGLGASGLKRTTDYILWYAKHLESLKYRQLFHRKILGQGEGTGARYDQLESPDGQMTRPLTAAERGNPDLVPNDWRAFQLIALTKPGPGTRFPITFEGQTFEPAPRWWGTTPKGIQLLIKTSRLAVTGKTLHYKQYLADFEAYEITNVWDDVAGAGDKVYVVQTSTAVIQRCLLMATDPGDLVLDPTCGSGSTSYVAEQWGRRWITIDTSRVALALARARIMGARYSYYLLADSREGQLKEAEVTRTAPSSQPVHGNIRHGFV